MEGFKSFKKVQCFKEGGSVAYKSRKGDKAEMHDDVAEDKKLIKKAFKQHDKAKHEGSEASEIKLKKGGRAKKEKGTVKKYKTGGEVTNVYEAKKKAGDLDSIQKVKEIKAAKLCGGKSVKKMADGRLTGAMSPVADMENLRMLNRAKNARKYLTPDQQAQFVAQGGMNPSTTSPDAAAAAPAPAAMPPQNQMGNPTGMPMKKGGKAKK